MADVLKTFFIGGELEVNRLGFGTMRLTGQPGNFGPYPDWEKGVTLLRRAADIGINFFDSAWAYGPETADRILGDALSDREVIFATKGGSDKPQPGKITVDGSRNTLLRQIDKALINLRRDRIDLYQLHRPDPEIPIEESVAALKEAKEDGRILHIGLSNVTKNELDRARGVTQIVSVQNRFNMSETEENEMVDYTAELGIAFIPWGPLGAIPMEYGAKLPPRESIAWLLKRSPNIIVIPGTTSIDHLEENWSAWELVDSA